MHLLHNIKVFLQARKAYKEGNNEGRIVGVRVDADALEQMSHTSKLEVMSHAVKLLEDRITEPPTRVQAQQARVKSWTLPDVDATIEELAQATAHAWQQYNLHGDLRKAAQAAAQLYGDPRMADPIGLMLYHNPAAALQWSYSFPE